MQRISANRSFRSILLLTSLFFANAWSATVDCGSPGAVAHKDYTSGNTHYGTDFQRACIDSAQALGAGCVGPRSSHTFTALPGAMTLTMVNSIFIADQTPGDYTYEPGNYYYCTGPQAGKVPGPPPPCPYCDTVGKPIVLSTGSEWYTETDFAGAGGNRLSFTRTYNSNPIATNSPWMPPGWTDNYNLSVDAGAAAPGVLVSRGAGKSYVFTLSGSTYVPDADISDTLTQLTSSGVTTGWIYVNASDDSVETFDASGNLQSISSRDGRVMTMTYSTASTPPAIAPAPGFLITVTDQFGHQINFTYATTLRLSMVDSTGQQYAIGNDPSSAQLVSVTYPDSSKLQYAYNESANTSGANLPNALTGIIDEDNARYATIQYSAAGNAINTQLAGGVQQYSVSYSLDGNGNILSAASTDPLMTTTTHTYSSLIGVNHPSVISQPAGAGSAAATSTTTYDVNGNHSSEVDFNGNLSCYVFDLTRNLETGRIEGMAPGSTCPANVATYTTVGTIQRKILTQNHPIWHLPAKIAEPLKITTYLYNGDSGNFCVTPTSTTVNGNPIGVLCSKSEQGTTDASGSIGFSATPLGPARTWVYTYNQYGQVLTAKDPLGNITTFTYQAATDTAHSPPHYYMGDLATRTDALLHATTFNQFDANGRLLMMTDPNGVVTTFAYSSRGWLTSKVSASPTGTSETTGFTYDSAGQLKQVTMPDGNVMKYTYDGAHRLTDITDSVNDTIHYGLDNMGNRTGEQTKDPSGNLTRNVARVFDALSRLQQVTGALQ